MAKPYKRAAIKHHTVPNNFGITDKGNPFKILSEPEKMPCPTFSLPAGKACPYAVYGPNAICSDCYACQGRYVMPNVKAPRDARFAWIREALKTKNGQSEVISSLVQAITATNTQYFRGHDSGDFFNPTYVAMWFEICSQVPSVKFWFPTRAWQNGAGTANHRMLTELRKLSNLPNVIRPSALYFGDAAPRVDGLSAGSTSDHDTTRQCIAPRQGGYCDDCRTCWDNDIEISYKHH